jgi:non-homologous end joining protein Ku
MELPLTETKMNFILKIKVMNDKLFDAIISLIEQGKQHKVDNLLKNLSKSRREDVINLLDAIKLLEI